MASRDDGDRDVDFQLVTTYIPLMVLILRGVALCVLCEVFFRLLGPRQNLLVVLIVLVYGDAYYWRHEPLNRVLGFLCPVAMCLLTTTDHTLCSPSVDRTPSREHTPLSQSAVYWTLQVVWPMTAASYFAASIFELKRPAEWMFVSFWALCLAVHCVLLLGGHQTTGEIMLRCMIYYIFGMLFYHSKIRLVAVDRNTHNLMSMHVCLHLLFVDVYMMIPSVVVLCVFLWYVFFGRRGEHAPFGEKGMVAMGALGAMGAHGHGTKSDEDLLSQLRAAKAKAIAV